MKSRRVAVAALVVSMLPTIAGAALLRPASAATGTPLGRFNFTTSGAAITSSGTLAAEGGLVITDQGAATVTGTLDSGPSAKVTAVSAEPGTTARTLLGSENLAAPPGAEAQYPGTPASDSDSDTGTGADTDTANASDLTGSATAAIASGTGAMATESLSANADDSLLSATVTSHSGAVSVAGVLDIGAVVGTVTLGYDGTGHHSSASVTVTGATVAGQPVSIDSSGVHALGVSPVPSGVIPTGAPAPVASLLAAAGITINVIDPVMTTTAHGGYADSGALVINEVTRDATSGITGTSSASDVTLYLGEASATLLDGPMAPAFVATAPSDSPTPETTSAPAVASSAAVVPVPAASPGVAGKPAVPGRVVTTVVGGSAPSALAAAPIAPVVPVAPVQAPAPTVAAPSVALPAKQLQLLGYRLDDSSALAGFGVWQLLTLGIATTAAMIARRREEPEEHLCPCP